METSLLTVVSDVEGAPAGQTFETSWNNRFWMSGYNAKRTIANVKECAEVSRACRDIKRAAQTAKRETHRVQQVGKSGETQVRGAYKIYMETILTNVLDSNSSSVNRL